MMVFTLFCIESEDVFWRIWTYFLSLLSRSKIVLYDYTLKNLSEKSKLDGTIYILYFLRLLQYEYRVDKYDR